MLTFIRPHAALAAVCFLLAACGSGHERPPRPPFSPNGEPLVGPGWPHDCEDAVGLWFDRADTNHDGRLTWDEFEADAMHQFDAMDIRHDGKITSASLAVYRRQVMGTGYGSISTRGKSAEATPDDSIERPGQRFPGGGGGRRDRDDDDDRRRTKTPDLTPPDIPDPVMSADVDLDGSVSRDEFQAFVRRNFVELDRKHEGAVEKDEVQKLCADSGS